MPQSLNGNTINFYCNRNMVPFGVPNQTNYFRMSMVSTYFPQKLLRIERKFRRNLYGFPDDGGGGFISLSRKSYVFGCEFLLQQRTCVVIIRSSIHYHAARVLKFIAVCRLEILHIHRRCSIILSFSFE